MKRKWQPDPYILVLLGLIGLWWLLAGSDTTPASTIRTLESSTDTAEWLEALGSDDRAVREFSRDNVISSLSTEELKSIATEAVVSDNTNVIEAGLWVMSRVEIEGRGEIAAGFLDHELQDIRKAALDVLAEDPVENAHDRILELTDDSLLSIQISAVKALSAYNDPDDLPLFIRFLGDTNSNIKDAARDGIRNLARESDTVLPALMAAAHNYDELAIAKESVSLLGDIGDDSSVDGLIELLSSGHVGLYSEAADAIGAIGSPAAISRVYELYMTADDRIRAQAARALGALSAVGITDDLWNAITDGSEDFWVRYWSLDALASCGDEYYITPLMDLLESPGLDSRLVRFGIEVLGGLGGDDVLGIYDGILDGTLDFGLLSAVGDTARIAAIAGLGRLGTDGSRDRLREIFDTTPLDDFAIINITITSLGKVGTPADIPVLESALQQEPILERVVSEAIYGINQRYPDQAGTEF